MKSRHAQHLPFAVLYEDDDLIVIDKPEGLLTTHTRLVGRRAREAQLTAENLLNAYVRKGQLKSRRQVYLVHRLDRETSGVMMFAKTPAVAEWFRAQWNAVTEKTYLAEVEGELAEAAGVFESYLAEDKQTYRVSSVSDPRAGKLARTEWRRLRSAGGRTWVEVHLKSGRKHQIRVHFAEAGHPVVGDGRYGGPPARRLQLHSERLVIRHPRTGERLEFTSGAGRLALGFNAQGV